jgi:hypothetical protein
VQRLGNKVGLDDKAKFNRLFKRHVPVITRRESVVSSDTYRPDALARFTSEAADACAQYFSGYHLPSRRWLAFYWAIDVARCTPEAVRKGGRS